jgi:hypothetical protein
MLDSQGKEIAVGDTVLVPFVVTRLSPGRNTIDLESVLKNNDGHHEHLTANAATVIKG